MNNRPVYEIAQEIKSVWSKIGKGVNDAAKPYLNAMSSLSDASDNYGSDSGKSIALYFFSNAQTFKGEDAKRLKSELKKVYGIK